MAGRHEARSGRRRGHAAFLVGCAIASFVALVSTITAQPPVDRSSAAVPTAAVEAPTSRTPVWVGAPLFPGEAEEPSDAFNHFALARYHNTPVFVATGEEPWGLGIVRRGAQLRARPRGTGDGCDGRWFELEAGGLVCSTRGFRVRASEVPLAGDEAAPPRIDALLPYRYGHVTTTDTYRFEELPTEAQLARLAEGSTLPGVAERLDGDYFVTIDGYVQHLGQRFVRTVAGRYVPAEHVGDHAQTSLHGQLLGEDDVLPLAFVIDDDIARLRPSSEGFDDEAALPKYARFRPTGIVSRDDVECVLAADGTCVPRASVRVAWAVERPEGVPEGEKWVHVNLSEQTLVAYEGDRPVFATVITSGKPGYDTPEGTFRIQHKYVSIRMSGDDPAEGVYDVDEVPWTMYYNRGYALHGAYWHDGFGRVRSHGCTNIAPADARWLYSWTTPHVPRGWHGRREEGTWVHNTTGGTPPLGTIDTFAETESESETDSETESDSETAAHSAAG